MTCSRPHRTATRLRLEPGTFRPKVLCFTTAPFRSFVFAYAKAGFPMTRMTVGLCLVLILVSFGLFGPHHWSVGSHEIGLKLTKVRTDHNLIAFDVQIDKTLHIIIYRRGWRFLFWPE